MQDVPNVVPGEDEIATNFGPYQELVRHLTKQKLMTTEHNNNGNNYDNNPVQ